MCVVADVLYSGPAGSMLSYVIHSLLLLPVRFVRPLLPDLLTLLPHLDKLNSILPTATVLEAEELSWSAGHGMLPQCSFADRSPKRVHTCIS